MMRAARLSNQIVVLDTETTGFDPEADGVLELATVMVTSSKKTGWCVGERWSGLGDPGCDIGVDAMATHHITPDMIKGLPSLSKTIPRANPVRDPRVLRAAHYAQFDRPFVRKLLRARREDDRWICTWKCARKIWPEAPSHKNQALRYWLPSLRTELMRDFSKYHPMTLPPHRALPDAWVTAHVLLRMLKEHTVDQLIEMTETPMLLDKIKFGKHDGELWENVPRSYLRWIIDQGPERMEDGKKVGFDEDRLHTATYWYDKR